MKIADHMIYMSSSNTKTMESLSAMIRQESDLKPGDSEAPQSSYYSAHLKTSAFAASSYSLGIFDNYADDANFYKKSGKPSSEPAQYDEKADEAKKSQENQNYLNNFIYDKDTKRAGITYPKLYEIQNQMNLWIIKLLKDMLGYDSGDVLSRLEEMRETIEDGNNSDIEFKIPEKNKPSSAYKLQQSSNKLKVSYQSVYFKHSSETVKFSAAGYINTSDGKQIALNLNFHSQKEEMIISASKTEFVRNKPKQIDPLVLNIDRPSFGLSNITIDFDLDCDGGKEKISFVNGSSAFLALDKNGDGKINDGSELFGPTSGDGFSDLRRYDLDGNGWIDENDTVFDKLKLWALGKNGKPELISIKDAGIGAIYLEAVKTDITLTNTAGDDKGALRQSGIFLKENGQAGTIAHIDLFA